MKMGVRTNGSIVWFADFSKPYFLLLILFYSGGRFSTKSSCHLNSRPHELWFLIEDEDAIIFTLKLYLIKSIVLVSIALAQMFKYTFHTTNGC